MTFADKVRELRKEKGWSQTELARKLGVNTRTIYCYENGSYPRYQKTYADLAEIFGVDVSYLRTETDAFMTEVVDQYGRRGQLQAQHVLEEVQQLLAGGELSEEDEIAFIRDVQSIYLDSKERAKRFTPKKYLKDKDAE